MEHMINEDYVGENENKYWAQKTEHEAKEDRINEHEAIDMTLHPNIMIGKVIWENVDTDVVKDVNTNPAKPMDEVNKT